MTNHIKSMANGVSAIEAFLTESTCSEACWHAREGVCRCSCGGKNHDCLRSADGVRPTRIAKIDGFRYELKAVGQDLYNEAAAINKAAGPKSSHTTMATFPTKKSITYTYDWETNDKGAPARLKTATESQVNSWPELACYRENIPDVWRKAHLGMPSLLWIKIN